MTDDYSFDGWGKLTSSTGSTANSQLYKGEYLAYRKDPDAGPELQYSTHHRNYNPQTGVFTAADPAKDDLNLYRYVKNNPVNKSDPSGLEVPPVDDAGDSISEEQFLLEISEEKWQNRYPHHVVTLLQRLRETIPPEGLEPIDYDETEEYYTMKWVLNAPGDITSFQRGIEDTRTRENYYGAGSPSLFESNNESIGGFYWKVSKSPKRVYVEDVDYLIGEARRLQKNPDEIHNRMNAGIVGDVVIGLAGVAIMAQQAGGVYSGRHRLRTNESARRQQRFEEQSRHASEGKANGASRPARRSAEPNAIEAFENEGGAQPQGRPSTSKARSDQAQGRPNTFKAQNDVAASSSAARDILDAARKAEPRVSGDLAKIQKAAGGEFAGFDKRLKTSESLQQKVGTRGVPAENINDALRYTIVFSEGAFSKGANQVMAELEALGYEKVSVFNSFRKGASYKGVNSTFRSPDGQLFELQFHTPKSYSVKQSPVHREIYEEMRLLPRTDPRWLELNNKLKTNSSVIPDPPGVKDVQ